MIFYRRTYRAKASRSETLLSAGLALFLVGLVLWFLGRGRQVDPDLFRLDEKLLTTAVEGPRIYRTEVQVRRSVAERPDTVADLLAEAIPGTAFSRSGPVEIYGPSNLYEKINGRETLYKTYGFRKLWFASYQAGEEILDVEVFQQENAMKAFGVFSTERQAFGGGEGGAPDRVETPNGLYVVIGDLYVRIQGSAASATIRKGSEALAAMLSPEKEPNGAEASKEETSTHEHPDGSTCPAGYGETCNFVPSVPGTEDWTPTANPLVQLGADPASLEYHAEYGLGVALFKGLYVGSIPEGDQQIRAFLLFRDSDAEAEEIQAGYAAILGRTGKPVDFPWDEAVPEKRFAVMVDMLDTYEVVVQKGRFVAGITEAEDAGAGSRVLTRLLALLPGGGK